MTPAAHGLYAVYEAARQRVLAHRYRDPEAVAAQAEVEAELYRLQEELLNGNTNEPPREISP
jgi:hypothetical protein